MFFKKDCNAIFTYTISFSIMKKKLIILKLFHGFISENLSNQFSKLTAEDTDNQ